MLCSILETGTCAHVASLNSGDHRAWGSTQPLMGTATATSRPPLGTAVPSTNAARATDTPVSDQHNLSPDISSGIVLGRIFPWERLNSPEARPSLSPQPWYWKGLHNKSVHS